LLCRQAPELQSLMRTTPPTDQGHASAEEAVLRAVKLQDHSVEDWSRSSVLR
jgi:hypothetical protein